MQQAEEEIRKALGRREESFLKLARNRIYENPTSPYLKLLKIAGCDYSDLRTQVHRYGLEATLERLAGEGVYLTADEFKGKQEVVRGRESFPVSPEDLVQLGSSPGFVVERIGAGNRRIQYSFASLDLIRMQAYEWGVFLFAHNLFAYLHAVYGAILPSTGAVRSLLIYAKLGIPADRWFARKVPARTWLGAQYHYLMTYLVVAAGKCFGPGFPRPVSIDIGDIPRIVRWLSESKRRGKSCCIRTVSGNATRIARLAFEMGLSLEGTKFIVSGEPFTGSKREIIERVGARAIPRYGFSEGGSPGNGCADPLYTDEVHVNQHMLAVIQHPRLLREDGPPIHPLLCTTLHSYAPKLLLNVANGDYATFVARDCGCALQKVGLSLHLHHIRSYEKFTSEGMNYFYGDLFEFFEKTLPSEFGGGPGDYQLVEEEDPNGQTRLTLVVHPQVGEVNEARLIARLRQGLSIGPWGNQFMTKVWREASTLRIKRQAPHSSPRGKILPLHIPR